MALHDIKTSFNFNITLYRECRLSIQTSYVATGTARSAPHPLLCPAQQYIVVTIPHTTAMPTTNIPPISYNSLDRKIQTLCPSHFYTNKKYICIYIHVIRYVSELIIARIWA